jgi:hypothetical protein
MSSGVKTNGVDVLQANIPTGAHKNISIYTIELKTDSDGAWCIISFAFYVIWNLNSHAQ